MERYNKNHNFELFKLVDTTDGSNLDLKRVLYCGYLIFYIADFFVFILSFRPCFFNNITAKKPKYS